MPFRQGSAAGQPTPTVLPYLTVCTHMKEGVAREDRRKEGRKEEKGWINGWMDGWKGEEDSVKSKASIHQRCRQRVKELTSVRG